MRPDLFLATIGRGSNGSNALEVTEDRAAVTAESQDNIINRVNNVSQYGPSWHYVPGIGVAGTAYAEVPGSALGDLAFTRASSKTRTNAAGVVETIASNVPPHDYRNADGTLSTFPRLNLEPQRTNSLVQSNNFATTWVTAFATVTSGQAGYDGTSNAWLLSKSNTDGRIGQTLALTSAAYTYTVFVKAGTKNWVLLRIDGTSNRTAYFNLQTGVTGTATGCTASIIPVGNGWHRCSITFTDSTSIARIYVADANNDTSGTSGNIFIQAAQLEAGAYATSYIPTTTATVTRIADAFTRSNIFTDGLISSAGGTWFVEISDNASVLRDNGSGLFIGDTAFANNGNQIIIRSAAPAAAARFSIIRYISGTATTLHTTTTNKIKVAVKWNGSVMDVFVNGVKVSASNLFTTTTMQNMIAGAGQIFEIDQMSLASTPLSDAQCIQLTTL